LPKLTRVLPDPLPGVPPFRRGIPMSFYPNDAAKPTWSLLSRTFAFHAAAVFTGILSPAFFQHHAEKHHVDFGNGQGDTFSDQVTLWGWLSQVFSGSKTCLAASTRVMVLCCSLSRPLPSTSTGGYCKARAKLPVPFLRDLTTDLGQQLEGHAPEHGKWHGRNVKLVDGTIVLLPDTPENLQEFPQQRSQKPGTSPTCMRLVVLQGLATAALLDAACGPYRGKGSGEISLFYSLLPQVLANDILLGDRYYGSYVLLALLIGRHADGCFRLPVGRQKEFHKGQRLGENDYLHTWTKPDHRPKWISRETWDALPDTLTVRLVQFEVRQRGFRTRQIYLVTTLINHQVYTLSDLADLYRERWNAELDIRSIKQSLGMKRLSCKTPAMVRAELWVHLLAYNLVRCVLAQAAADKGLQPRQLSFTAGVQTLDAFRWLLSCQEADNAEVSQVVRQALVAALSVHRVGNRPDRWEPREIKHQQRKYPELKKSRQQRRDELQEPADEKPDKGRGKSRPSGRGR
jgi:putative transposase